MPRKKREVQETNVATTEVAEENTQAVLKALEQQQAQVPDDPEKGIALRDRTVLHLLAGADLHRVGDDVIEHRIKRCIGIADLVVKLLGEDK